MNLQDATVSYHVQGQWEGLLIGSFRVRAMASWGGKALGKEKTFDVCRPWTFSFLPTYFSNIGKQISRSCKRSHFIKMQEARLDEAKRGLNWTERSYHSGQFKSKSLWDFPGDPVVRPLHFHGRGHRFNSWSRSWDPASPMVQPKNRKIKAKASRSTSESSSSAVGFHREW